MYLNAVFLANQSSGCGNANGEERAMFEASRYETPDSAFGMTGRGQSFAFVDRPISDGSAPFADFADRAPHLSNTRLVT